MPSFSKLRSVALSIVGTGFVALIFTVTSLGIRDTTLNEAARDQAAVIEAMMAVDQVELDAFYDYLEKLLGAIHRMPPISGIDRALLAGGRDPVDGSTSAQWQERLATIVQAFKATHPWLVQFRLINARNGQEMVRVVRRPTGELYRLPEEELRNASSEDFFTRSLNMAEEQVYFSPIDLVRESGQIVRPLQPVLRAGLLARNDRGEAFSVIAIEAHVVSILETIGADPSPNVKAWVTNAAGHFLWDPVTGQAFSHLLTPPGTTFDQHYPAIPNTASFTTLPVVNGGAIALHRALDGVDWLVLKRPLLDPDAYGDGGLVLHSAIPSSIVEAAAMRSAMPLLLLVAVMSGALLWLVLHRLTHWDEASLEKVEGSRSAQKKWSLVPCGLLTLAFWILLGLIGSETILALTFVLMLIPVLLCATWGGAKSGVVSALVAVPCCVALADPGTAWWDPRLTEGMLWPTALATSGTLLVSLAFVFTQEVSRRRAAKVVALTRSAGDTQQRLIRQAPIAVAMFDLQMRYLATSARWLTDFGVPPEQDVIGHAHYDIFPKIPEPWKEVHRRAMEGETFRGQEDRFERLDGSKQILDWECTPWRTSEGAIGGIIIWTKDITENFQARERLLETLQRKATEAETLLKEVHHRVKNNLQVVSSLLSLQRQRTSLPEVAEALQSSRNRISTMAILHEQLYRGENLGIVNIKRLLQTVSKTLLLDGSSTCRVRFQIEGDEIETDLQTATPCALAIAELLTNALKHAFHDRPSGEIALTLISGTDGFSVSLQDNGVGLPRSFDLATASSTGLRLVQRLVTQAGGHVEIQPSSHGTCITASFTRRATATP